MTQRTSAQGLTADDTDGALSVKGPASSFHSLNSAATTNATSVKATAGEPLTLLLSNTGTACFFKMYNKASAPVVGTDIPVVVIPLMAGGSVGSFYSEDFGINGPKFSLGLAYAITGAVADSDTTAVAAAQVKVVLQYR